MKSSVFRSNCLLYKTRRLLAFTIAIFSSTHVSVAYAWDASIPKTQNTALAEEILKSNSGNILTPDLLKSLKPLSRPIGWEFAMVDSKHREFDSSVFLFRLTAIAGNEYYFDYVDPPQFGEKVSKYKWVNGYQYYARNNRNKNNPAEFAISSEEQCKFTLGICEFASYSGVPQKQYTEFTNGVWIHKQTSLTSTEGNLIKWIYDSSGFPLYYYYESLKTHGIREERRLDR